MLDENALYEELADENELKDHELGGLFEYHRLSNAKNEIDPANFNDRGNEEPSGEGLSRGTLAGEGDHLSRDGAK
jgi:hypothetical protein